MSQIDESCSGRPSRSESKLVCKKMRVAGVNKNGIDKFTRKFVNKFFFQYVL